MIKPSAEFTDGFLFLYGNVCAEVDTAKNTFFDGKFFGLLHCRFVQIKLLLVKSCKFCYIFYPVGFVIDNNKLSVLNKRKVNRTLNYYCCIGLTSV